MSNVCFSFRGDPGAQWSNPQNRWRGCLRSQLDEGRRFRELYHASGIQVGLHLPGSFRASASPP